MVLAELDQLPVEVQQGVRVLLLLGDVNLPVVLIHIEPGRGLAEAGVFLRRPLHRAAGVVPRAPLHQLEHLALGHQVGGDARRVLGGYVRVHLDPRQRHIQHADLLPLIDKGRAPLEHVHRRQHLPALHPVLLTPVAGDDARMVVVFYVQRVPGLTLQLALPVAHGALELEQAEGPGDHIRQYAVGLHVGEGDHLVQHLVRPLGDVAQGRVRRGAGALPHHKAVVMGQHVPLELRQVVVNLRLVGEEFEPVDGREPGMAVGQARGLGDEGHHILPEAVHPHVQPEAHDLLELLPHAGIVQVQIRLLFGEEMQIVFVQALVVLPGAALEMAGPVVGRQAAPAHRPALPPVVIVVVGVIPALAAGLKPGVLVRAVVHHQVEEDAHALLMGLVQQFPEHVQVAEIRVDVFVVGDVVAVIRVGRGIDRGEPDGVRAEALDVVQLLDHAPEVADAVAVSVAEAPGPDVIDAHLLVPAFRRHDALLPFRVFVVLYHSFVSLSRLSALGKLLKFP